MQNKQKQCELYEGLHGPKRTEAAELRSQVVRKVLRKEIEIRGVVITHQTKFSVKIYKDRQIPD